MKGAEELGELLFGCSRQHSKVLDWYKKHENDDVFKTEEGKKIRNHLGEMMKQEALAMMSLGIIELEEALTRPDIFISEETFNMLKEAIECREEGS